MNTLHQFLTEIEKSILVCLLKLLYPQAPLSQDFDIKAKQIYIVSIRNTSNNIFISLYLLYHKKRYKIHQWVSETPG